jgi:FKBP-type peptidyl-prolyl cis-trans isomerase
MRPALCCVGLALIAAGCGGGARAAGQSSRTWPLAPIDSATMIPMPSGVLVRDLAVGHGALVHDGNVVSVYYVGQLLDGTQFDAAVPDDAPLRFQMGAHRVIRGWEEGVAGMRVGGKRQLMVPPALAYGSHGMGPIPPNATLVFTIEVVRVD